MEGFSRHDACLSIMILVIGGGWSGLACAVGLRQRTDLPITLLEAAPEFGGRARGLTWNNRLIDNGQHLTIGAYREMFALLDLVGASAWERQPLRWCGVGLHREITQRWRVPSSGWPWRVVIGMLPWMRPRGWPMKWQQSMRAILSDLLRHDWRLRPDIHATTQRGPSVAQWLDHYGVPHDFVQHFWRPLAEGALNTEIDSASARVLAIVLRDSLGGPAGSCDVYTPPANLSIDGVDAITGWLAGHDVTLLSGHRAQRLAPSDGAGWSVQIQHSQELRTITAQAVVIALPFQASARLWSQSTLPATPASQRWEKLDHRAITTVWLALSEAQEQRLGRLPNWFVLNPQPGVPHIAQVAIRRPGILGVVISAQQLAAQGPASSSEQESWPLRSLRSELEPGLTLQLRAQLDLDLDAMEQKWITEKSATWACTVDAPMPSDAEVRGETGLAGVYRCADDLVPGYPATIESAVRSGNRIAEQVMTEFY